MILDRERIMFEFASFLSFSVYENVAIPLRATQLRFAKVLQELSRMGKERIEINVSEHCFADQMNGIW